MLFPSAHLQIVLRPVPPHPQGPNTSELVESRLLWNPHPPVPASKVKAKARAGWFASDAK